MLSLIFSLNVLSSDFTISVQKQAQSYYDGNNNKIGDVFDLERPNVSYLRTQWGDYRFDPVGDDATGLIKYGLLAYFPNAITNIVHSDNHCQVPIGAFGLADLGVLYSNGILAADDSGNPVKLVFSDYKKLSQKTMTIKSMKSNDWGPEFADDSGCITNTSIFPSENTPVADLQVLSVTGIPSNFFPLKFPITRK